MPCKDKDKDKDKDKVKDKDKDKDKDRFRECELKIGLNRVFFQLIAQGMEFIYMIFSPKNLFTLTSSVYALAKLTAELMRTTLFVVCVLATNSWTLWPNRMLIQMGNCAVTTTLLVCLLTLSSDN